MRTILLTGGAGFIGFHVANALLENGDNIIIIDNFNDYYDVKLKKDRINQIKNNKNIKIYKSDITDICDLRKIFKKHKIDKVCHLAAQAGVRYSLKDPFRYELTNNLGTLNILELCKEFKIKDFIFASSSSVYGGNEKIPFSENDKVDTPISVYAATKKTNELYAYTYHHLYGMNCIGLRFFTVYGPWGRPDMAYFKFTKSIIENKPIDIYNFGDMKRDFTYITDIVDGILFALDNIKGYDIINLGGDNPVDLNYFISCIEKSVGKKAKKKFLPMQEGDLKITVADVTLARKKLNYSPKIKVDKGIQLFVDWYKGYYKC